MMKKCNLLLLSFVLTLGMTVFTTGCSSEKQGTVRVNEVTHSVFYAPFYLSVELGFFEEEGLTVELTNGGGSDKSMTALLTGSADIILAGPETAIYVANEGRSDPAKVFFQLTQKDGSFLLGKEPDDNFSWEKLRGKSIIGGRTGGMPEMVLEYVLKQQSLIPGSDLTVRTDVSYDLMGGAFIGGEDDYVTMFEPSASAMEMAGEGYIVASVGEAGGKVPYTCFITLQSSLEKDPETEEKFARAVLRGIEWMEEHTAKEAAEVIAPSFADSDIDLLTAVIERYSEIDVWKSDPVMEKEDYERLIAVITEAGIITESPDFETVIDNSIVKRISAGK